MILSNTNGYQLIQKELNIKNRQSLSFEKLVKISQELDKYITKSIKTVK